MDEQFEGGSICSPPYPGLQAGARTLYEALAALRNWVVEQQHVLRNAVPEKPAAKLTMPANMPDEAVWNAVSVLDKWRALAWLRSLREAWDAVLREHEDSWDSVLALRKRFGIVLAAQRLLEEAFISPEVREMRLQQATDQAKQANKAIQARVKQYLIPPELQEDDSSEDDDDGW